MSDVAMLQFESVRNIAGFLIAAAAVLCFFIVCASVQNAASEPYRVAASRRRRNTWPPAPKPEGRWNLRQGREFFRVDNTRRAMSTISYRVSRYGDDWAVLRNGESEGSYATQEAAFEVASARASAELRTGHSVVVEAATPTDPAGAADLGGRPMRGDGFS
jgi:hypothetical protein